MNKATMAVLLDLFFDDYGFPCRWAWVIYFTICGITVVFLWFCSLNLKINKEEKVLFKYASISAIFLYLILFSLVNSLNQYEYIPISGTDIQKDNLERCTFGKNATLENINNIMNDCKNRI